MSYWESDNFCLAQLGAWRMRLQNVSRGDITRVKNDFVRNLRQNENFGNHTDAAVASHFTFTFLDKYVYFGNITFPKN
jgi:hypothetical protein